MEEVNTVKTSFAEAKVDEKLTSMSNLKKKEDRLTLAAARRWSRQQVWRLTLSLKTRFRSHLEASKGSFQSLAESLGCVNLQSQ